MNNKSSAHYQREYRKRLRESGFVKREVWILPEHKQSLSNIEKRLRRADGIQFLNELDDQVSWTVQALLEALRAEELFVSGAASLSLVDINGEELVIRIVMHEYGDLPIFVSIAGQQMLVEAVLWSADDVLNPMEFNVAVLKTHKYFPLTTVSLERVEGYGDTYFMFGSLSSCAQLSNVIIEIEILATNVIQATEAYRVYLKPSLLEKT